MNCPMCRGGLTDNIFGGVVYQKCGSCGGFWFDKGELYQIRQEKDWFKIDTVVKGGSSRVKKGSLACPRCNRSLNTIEYSHETDIKINVCPACEGLWLESGELKAIHHAGETWIEKLKDRVEEDLTAVELFLIKIGVYLPK